MLTRLRAAFADDRFRRRAWLVAILGILAFYKIDLTIHTYWTNMDGGTYIEIASHVRDGQGLVTNCSPNHSGFPHFPFPTANYPLWPLVVGYAARLFPITEAGKWLATACYFATLVFAYLWGSTLLPKPLFPKLAPGFDAGHVLVVMFGLHDFFNTFTSWPYTEGLGYALTTAALWRTTRILPKPTWRGGLELGVWCGLIMLARYQLVLVAMAMFPVLAGAAVLSSGPRKQYALMAVLAAVGMGAVVGPHYLYVRSFTPDLTPALYVQWQRVHVTEGFSFIDDVIEVKGLVPFLLDRAKGFEFAFDPRDKRVGYFLRYYTFCYAIFAALPLSVWLGVRALRSGKPREVVLEGWAWARKPENLHWVFAVVFAVGCFVMIHSLHMHQPYPEWYFAQRHAIACMFLFWMSLVLLLSQQGRARAAWKLLGVAIFASGTVIGIGTARAHAVEAEAARPSAPAPGLVKWLNQEAVRRGGKLVVAFRQPQPFMYLTPNVGYHWYFYGTTLSDIRKYFELGASYLFVPNGQTFSFMQGPEFGKLFRQVKVMEGFRVFELVKPPDAAPPPQPPAQPAQPSPPPPTEQSVQPAPAAAPSPPHPAPPDGG